MSYTQLYHLRSSCSILFNSLRPQSNPDVQSELLNLMRKNENAFVVTPNIHHLKTLLVNEELRQAYQSASHILPDGWPIAILSSMKNGKVIKRQTGSDLLSEILVHPDCDFLVRIAILGGSANAATLAANRLTQTYSSAQVVFTDRCSAEDLKIDSYVQRMKSDLEKSRPHIVLVGLGCPKQEIFVMNNFRNITAGVVCCVGAGVEFLAGTRNRAPRFLQKIGLEWLHRLSLEPKRMFGRYAIGSITYLLFFCYFCYLTTKQRNH